MLKYFTTLLCLSVLINVQAQFSYRLESYPDSAEVYLNDELRCFTPCNLKYYWREKNDGIIVFKIKKPGFKEWEQRLTSKPRNFNDRESVELKFDYPTVDGEELPLIAFDKLVINFKEGRKIGEVEYLKKPVDEVEWEGSSRVGDDSFSEIFIETATKMGLNTLLKSYAELFSEENNEDKNLPRFIIGVEMMDIDIRMKEVKTKSYFPPIHTQTKLSFKWSVFDKKSEEVVFTKSNQADFSFRQEPYQKLLYIEEVFELALIDFLKDQKFMSQLEKSGSSTAVQKEETAKEKILINSPTVVPYTSFSELVRNATKSCVTIITDGGYGSGALIDPDGIVLTAYHVIKGVNKLEVKLNSGIQVPAELISYNKKSDLALLKINGSGFNALPIHTDVEYGIGDEVVTIGTPAELELGQSLSKGFISGKRKLEDRIYIQLNMSVSPGNSGGPLLNEKGEIIGVVLSKIVDKGVEGIGFAVPVETLIKDLNLLVKD